MDLAVSSSAEALTQLQAPWQKLFDACPAAHIFLSWEWASRWWAHFGKDQQPYVISLRAGGELAGLAPLLIRQVDSASELRFIGREETTDYADLLALNGHEETVTTTLLQHVDELRQRGSSAVLEPLPEDSLLLNALRSLAPPASRLADGAHEPHASRLADGAQVERIEPCPYLTLPASWDAYLANLPKKDRHELRRKLRRAESEGPLTLDVATSPQDIAERLPFFFAMHRASADIRKAKFLDPRMQAFFSDVCGALAERGWVRLSLLRLHDQPIASALSFHRGDTVALYNSGFDPAFSSLSPGIALVALELQSAIEHGRAIYDFLRGDERYKYDLGGQNRYVYRATFSPSPMAPAPLPAGRVSR